MARLAAIFKFPHPESSPQSAVDPFLLLVGKFIAARSANPNEHPSLASSKELNLRKSGVVMDCSHSQDQAIKRLLFCPFRKSSAARLVLVSQPRTLILLYIYGHI